MIVASKWRTTCNVFNLHRRHLTPSQKSMVAVKLKELLEPEAKERQEKSRATKGNKVGSKVVEKLPPPIDNAALFAADQERKSAKSRDRAAAAVGISGKLVDAAEDAWLRGVRMLASCYRGRDRFYL